MASRLFDRLARLERELAEEETVIRLVEPPWMRAMHEEAEAKRRAMTSKPAPESDEPVPVAKPKPAPSAEPDEPA